MKSPPKYFIIQVVFHADENIRKCSMKIINNILKTELSGDDLSIEFVGQTPNELLLKSIALREKLEYLKTSIHLVC